MTTTAADLFNFPNPSTTTMTNTEPTTRVTGSTPTSGIHERSPGGSSAEGATLPSARQLDDLNFYLRRMNMGGGSDISQIESFGGGSDYEMFLGAVNSIGIQAGWAEHEMVRIVEMKLKDKAQEYYGSLLPGERPKTMVEMKEWFRRVFGRRLTITAGKRELEKCIRIPGQPLGEYAQRLKLIANKMFPASVLGTPEKLYHRNLLLVNQFIDGLDRRLANEILRAGEFYNLDDCLEVAEECEEIVSRMRPEIQ